MLTVIKNADIYAPASLGINDILIADKKIEKIEKNITLSNEYAREIDARGRKVIPGFIDQHVHITGGGGEKGFKTRAPEAVLSEFIKAGTTTVLGLLGTDSQSRSIENLIAKTKALNEEGMTAFCSTGGYEYPSPTFSGSVKKDIAFISEMIGVKIAISDHRASYMDAKQLENLVSNARVGGMFGNKAGIVTLHMGGGEQGLSLIRQVLKNSSIPKKHFIPTHMSRDQRLMEDGFLYLKEGGYIDITAGDRDDYGRISAAEAIMKAREKKLPLENISISSDGHGSWSEYDELGNLVKIGVSSLEGIHFQVKKLLKNGLKLDEAIPFATKNVAKMLKLDNRKGQIKEGFDADVIFLDEKYNVDTVFMMGKLMMENKELLVKGSFEQ